MYGEKKLCSGGRPKLIHCVKSVHQNLYMYVGRENPNLYTFRGEGRPKLIYIVYGEKIQTYIYCLGRDPNIYIYCVGMVDPNL